MTEPKDSCVKPAKGPIGLAQEPMVSPGGQAPVALQPARVGKPAPDFEASAYVKGGFKNLKLSSLKGKWVVLCFYPGDFTFV
jgi:peroxiredoxin (alkyl hydroperoxide reductase subunit C)